MTFAIILLALMILIGIAGIATGVYAFVEGDIGCGILGTFLGAILLFMIVGGLTAVIEDNSETTEKVLGKGTIVTEVDFNYSNGGKDSSNEIKYFIEIESGDKIIVDKSEWNKIKDEYTYIPSKVDIIKED